MLQESGFSPDLTVVESVRLIDRLTEGADGHAVELIGLSAALTRLDDVVRAIDASAAAEL